MRHDIYRRPHKAVRAMMAGSLTALQSADPGDECDMRDALAQLEEMLAFCEAHAALESAFVHREIEARSPGSACFLATEHAAQEREIEALRTLARERHPDLHRHLALFIADNLRHMEDEETRGNALLWAHFSDAEIVAIERRLVASKPPGETMQALRWMLPALNHRERVALMAGLRAAPPAMLAAALGVARTHLQPRDAARLEESLRDDKTTGVPA